MSSWFYLILDTVDHAIKKIKGVICLILNKAELSLIADTSTISFYRFSRKNKLSFYINASTLEVIPLKQTIFIFPEKTSIEIRRVIE
jgi:hypothetical protein